MRQSLNSYSQSGKVNKVREIVYYGLPFERDEVGSFYCHCRHVIYANHRRLFIDDYYAILNFAKKYSFPSLKRIF